MNEIIPHRNFKAAKTRLARAIDNFRPGRLIIIIGVGGVGKTTLRYEVLRERFSNPDLWGIGCIPVIEVMALLPDKAYFNSKAWAENSLNQLFVPDLDWLTRGADRTPEMDAIEAAISRSSVLWNGARPKLTEAAAWSSFRENAKTRKLKVYSLEHASSLCFNHKDTTPAHHILNFMSLMESAGTMGLLTTIQKGVELWRDRSEIRRRTDVIWLAPYDVSIPEDNKEFLGLLRKICMSYEFEPKNLLSKMAPEIAAATAGVYAEMVNLMDKAFDNATDAGRTAIRECDIQAAYYGEKELATLWRDVEAFWDAKRSDSAENVSGRADKIWPKAA